MKKSRLFILSSIIPCALALSGCFLTRIVNDIIDVTPTENVSIDVVSEVKINLSKTNTKQLDPQLVGATKNYQFVYSSSNSNVATVSSTGLITAHSVGETSIIITLDSNRGVATSVKVKVVDETTETYDYTIMLYMCGSTLEYDKDDKENPNAEFFTKDIQEILSVSGMPDSVKIIIETGGAERWFMPSSYLEGATSISSTSLERWEVNNSTGKLKHIATLNTNEMAKESSFESFLNWGLDDYEADQMGVIISGHGGGIAGCAYDDNYTYKYGNYYYSHTLQTFEVATAAKNALANSNKDKFTWIGYDCCLMQCADIASINSDYFEYMVASQEEEVATGWNHDVYLEFLKKNTHISPTEFLPKICDAFLSDNHVSSETSRTACYQTLSVLDLSKIPSLTTSFNSLVTSLGLTNQLRYTAALSAFKSVSYLFGEGIYGLCDFKQLMNKISGSTAVINALDDLVLYSKSCSKYSFTPCGVNAFFPYENNSKEILQVGKEDYENALSTKFTNWQKICVDYGTFGW